MSIFFISDLTCLFGTDSSSLYQQYCREEEGVYQSPYIDWGFIYSLFQSKGVVKTSPFVAIYQPRSLLREFFFYLSIYSCNTLDSLSYILQQQQLQPSIICYSRLQMGILTQFQLAVKITNYHRTYTILQEHIDLLFCSLSSFIEKYEPSTN